jgi:hypothetical protein
MQGGRPHRNTRNKRSELFYKIILTRVLTPYSSRLKFALALCLSVGDMLGRIWRYLEVASVSRGTRKRANA